MVWMDGWMDGETTITTTAAVVVVVRRRCVFASTLGGFIAVPFGGREGGREGGSSVGVA